MRLTSTGLGIGTSSPASTLDVRGTSPEIKLVATTGTNGVGYTVNNTGGNFYFGRDSNTGGYYGSSSAYSAVLWSTGAYPMVFATNNTERARIDSAGNMGLGVTPSAWNTSNSEKVFQFDTGSLYCNSGNDIYLNSNWFLNSSSQSIYIENDFATSYSQQLGQHQWYTAASGTAGNAISFTQAMSLDASGNLLVGDTSNIFDSTVRIYGKSSGFGGFFYTTASSGYSAASFSRNGNDGNVCQFYRVYNGSAVGSISVTSSATAYNTSSDYRLKNITGPITTSGAYIDSLNPVEGTWKADGSTFVGLIAHEVQEASRTQVATGTKDGEEMQAIDYSNSELIANLIAEVKSLRQRVATLEAQ
jgi:hypothetical protein